MNCRRNRSRWSRFCDRPRPRAISGTLAVSGARNALPFKAGLAILALVYALMRGRHALYSTIINGGEPRRRSMTRVINNRRRNQKNRHKLAALAKKAKKERHRLS